MRKILEPAAVVFGIGRNFISVILKPAKIESRLEITMQEYKEQYPACLNKKERHHYSPNTG